MLDIEDEVFHASIDRGCLTSKGSWFRAEADKGDEMFFRTTFAAASLEDMTEAIRRFGEGLRAVFGVGVGGNGNGNGVNGHGHGNGNRMTEE